MSDVADLLDLLDTLEQSFVGGDALDGVGGRVVDGMHLDGGDAMVGSLAIDGSTFDPTSGALEQIIAGRCVQIQPHRVHVFQLIFGVGHGQTDRGRVDGRPALLMAQLTRPTDFNDLRRRRRRRRRRRSGRWLLERFHFDVCHFGHVEARQDPRRFAQRHSHLDESTGAHCNRRTKKTRTRPS